MARPKVEKIESESLVAVNPELLSLEGNPEKIVEQAVTAAAALKQFLEDPKRKKLIINGRRHLFFEDWQLIARFYGVTPVEKFSTYVERGELVKGYSARSEALLISRNQVISAADAECLTDEGMWARKPLFQLCSMAQTRANAKCLRNVLAWVVILMGFSPTPAEEVENNQSEEEKPPEPEKTWADRFWETAKANRRTGKDVRAYLNTIQVEKISQVPLDRQAEAMQWAETK